MRGAERKHLVERIDKALSLVDGNFIVAAKLIDLRRRRLQNMVNETPWLKERWGKTTIGRPARAKPNFEIREYNAPNEIRVPQLIKIIADDLSLDQKVLLRDWLVNNCPR
jgi:hypothetical protein